MFPRNPPGLIRGVEPTWRIVCSLTVFPFSTPVFYNVTHSEIFVNQISLNIYSRHNIPFLIGLAARAAQTVTQSKQPESS